MKIKMNFFRHSPFAICLFLFLALVIPLSFAQSKSNNNELIVFPAFFSTPETGFGGGFSLLNVIDRGMEKSDIYQITGLLTEKNQYLIFLLSEINILPQDERFKGLLVNNKFPSFFYGIGPKTGIGNKEAYTPYMTRLELSYLWPINNSQYAGLKYIYSKQSIKDVIPGGIIDSSNYNGKTGSVSSGFGLAFEHDTRDHRFYPTKGFYNQTELIVSPKFLGSDTDWWYLKSDERKFFIVIDDIIFAVQNYFLVNTGDVPMFEMAQMGGGEMMRGYYRGRYIDKIILADQIELRFPLWSIVSGTIYLGYSQVMPDLKSFTFSNYKMAWGYGLRFRLNESQKINLRLDFAYSHEDSNMYISLAEAF